MEALGNAAQQGQVSEKAMAQLSEVLGVEAMPAM